MRLMGPQEACARKVPLRLLLLLPLDPLLYPRRGSAAAYALASRTARGTAAALLGAWFGRGLSSTSFPADASQSKASIFGPLGMNNSCSGLGIIARCNQ